MQPSLPQNGWFLDLEWTEALYGKLNFKQHERKLKTFRKNIRDADINHFTWGDHLVTHTTDFFDRPSAGRQNGTDPRLPQSGVFKDEEWAEAFGEEVTTFRSKVRKHCVPHQVFGNTMLVSAEDFYEAMGKS